MLLLAFLNERLTRKPLERAQAQARRAARFIDANVRNAEVVERARHAARGDRGAGRS